MRKLVEVMGGMEWVDILEKEEIFKMNVRYIGTDFETGVDVYEECTTGKFYGKIR